MSMYARVKNKGQASTKMQIFGAGGVEDQAATRLSIAASAPSNGSSQRVEAREVIALATASGTDGDHQLTKPGQSEHYIQQNIANANPEFGYRNLTTKDAFVLGGEDEDMLEGLDVLDGVSSGDAIAMLRGSSDQTSEDTTIALQNIFSKAFSQHQSHHKAETASLDISTQKLMEENPFAKYNSAKSHPSAYDGDDDEEENGEDPQMSADPLYAASKQDGLDFYFANNGGEADGEEEAKAAGDASHFQQSMQSSGLRRVGMRKSQSSMVDALADADDLDQMREGFSLQQRAEGDWDSHDKLDVQRMEDIDKLRFPGAQYLAHQPSMLTTMSTRTAASRSKKSKKNKGASGTMGSTGFA
jgi:hypothetical protein